MWESILSPLFSINNPFLSAPYLSDPRFSSPRCSPRSSFWSCSLKILPFVVPSFQAVVLQFPAVPLSPSACPLGQRRDPRLVHSGGCSLGRPVTDGTVWGWLFGLCPSKIKGREPRERGVSVFHVQKVWIILGFYMEAKATGEISCNVYIY